MEHGVERSSKWSMYKQDDQDIDRINIEGYQHALEFCQQEGHVGHEHQST